MDNKFVGPGGAKVGGGADTDKLNIDSIIARLLEGKYVFFLIFSFNFRCNPCI